MKIFEGFSKRFLVLSILVAVIISGAGFVFLMKEREPGKEYTAVRRGTIVQEVTATGKTKPSTAVHLAFETGGRISEIPVKTGEEVEVGQILIRLDSREIASQVAEAEANVKYQQAKLEELQRGTRYEEIRVQEVKVENAEIAVIDAKRNLFDRIRDAFTKSDDAVRIKTDQFFSSPRSADPQLDFQLADQTLETAIESERTSIELILNSWKTSADAVSTDSSNLENAALQASLNLKTLSKFLDKIGVALGALDASTFFTQTTIDGWKSDNSSARTNVNTAAQNLSAAEEKLRSAKANFALAQNELSLKKAGAAPEQITAQEAQLRQAEAKLRAALIELDKTVLRSPIDGIVTAQNGEKGEVVQSNAVIVSVQSRNKIEIEAHITEADIAKIATGHSAKITFDAYPNESFNAAISTIDPAETVIDGVSTYKTTFQLSGNDPRIKTGFTANIDIVTARRENALIIPRRALISRNGATFVKILRRDKSVEETPVTAGLTSALGDIEITGGLNEGDVVVVSERK